MLMPFTCAWPLRSVAIGAGVGGKVSHLSAANAGKAARTRRGVSRNGRMSFSLGAVEFLISFRPFAVCCGGPLANDPDGGNRVGRHQARWRQNPALFIGAVC